MKKYERRIHTWHRLAVLALCLGMVCTLLVACGKSADRAQSVIEKDYAADFSDNEKPSSMEGTSGKNELYHDTMDTATTAQTYATKIIRTARLSAETKRFDDALAEIEASVTTLCGYVQSSEVSGRGGNGSSRATMTLRIPAEKLDLFLETTGALVNVISSSTSADDVSGQYYDIEARLSVLETERSVLEQILAETKNLSDIISVENRLYDVIYEIESYKTQLKLYDSKIAYATVYLTLTEVSDLTVVAADATFGARLQQAFVETWQNFAAFCKDGVIWAIYALPALILVVAVGIAAVVTVLRIRKKKARKLATEAKKEGSAEEQQA